MKIIKLAAIAAALALGLSACGSDPTEGEGSASDTITVGSAGFAENEIIAEIYYQALDAEGIKVEKKMKIGAREVYIPALQNGEIDLIPEYTGNLLTYFDKEATASAPDEVEKALDDALPDGLEILDVSPAEDKDSLNVTKKFADDNGIASIADLSKIKDLRLAANPEFKTRSYGLPGMEELYGIKGVKFTAISDNGGPATLKALLDGDVDVADIYSTTPSIQENNLVTLADPKNMIAAQNVVPLINDDKDSDEVEKILNAISAALTTESLLDMNTKNSGPDKVSPADLAKEWLAANPLS